jgi:hypothetical protein
VKASIQNLLQWLLLLPILGSLANCGSGGSGITKKPKPAAYGRINDVVVITDPHLWEGSVGDTLDYYLGSAYPILPQPEPLFDLRFFSLEDLEKKPIRKELRTLLILADLADTSSAVTKMVQKDLGEEKFQKALSDSSYVSTTAKDKWAQGQNLIYVFGQGEEQMASNIKKVWKSLAKKINDWDKSQIYANLYLPGRNKELEKWFLDKYKMQLEIPKSYFLALEDSLDAWLRLETDKYSLNFMLSQIPYTQDQQLTKAYMIAMQDSLGKWVSSTLPNTYKRTNVVDLPATFQWLENTPTYTLESRGVWEMEGDFMGGPFVSRLLLSPDSKTLFFIEAFLYAPGREKRELMQELVLIMDTLSYID